MARVVARVLAGSVAAAVAGFVALRSPEPDYARIEVETTADLERELESLRARLDIPGLAAAIADGDRIVWARGFGFANRDRQVPVDPETTSFHLASVTKPYTAVVVLQLADEGRVDLDAPVSDFGITAAGGETVRVRHLLSHTSGAPPGTAYRYDARAYGDLTTVVERASGRRFAAELTDRLVRRLNLAHTGPNPRNVDRAACRAQLASWILQLCGSEEQAIRARDL